jgi:uncharacterized membrane protein
MEQRNLPNATVSLVLGILSILTCFCYGIIGLTLGIIAFVLGNKALKIHTEDPTIYTGEGNAKAGKILGIIGVVLGLIYLCFVVFIIYKIGTDAIGNPELMQQRLEELVNSYQ